MANMSKIDPILSLLPDNPGCYLMKDINNEIIYVGKAKNLKKRVRSYFNGAHNLKTTRLVADIDNLEYIITNSEKEALLLELNLIKEYDPKYNIVFKDDKTYPYIKIKLNDYPSIIVSRNTKDKKAIYYGPYPNSSAAYDTLNLLNQLYPLVKCKKIPKKACLYYHINQCLAPCINKIDSNIYNDMINSIKKFLSGDTSHIVNKLINERNIASNNLNFELAQEKQKLISSIEHIVEKQNIDFKHTKDQDIFGYYSEFGYMCIQAFIIRNGKIIERKFKLKSLYNDELEYFESYIIQYYMVNLLPKQLIITKNIDATLIKDTLNIDVIQPLRGDKLKLLTMVEDNAKKTLLDEFKTVQIQEDRKLNALNKLNELLGINVSTIEIFDNSHIAGNFNVSGMVVYKDGLPKRNDYRLFKLDNYISDMDSMKEVIFRRYSRVKSDNLKQADLIIVDGGMLQVNAAHEILSSIGLDIFICGLVKDDKHKTNALIDQNGVIYDIDRDSELFLMLANMQDEVHRYVITYHKKLRSKALTKSFVDDIVGMGEVKKKKLWNHYKTLSNLKKATYEELEQLFDKRIAKQIIDALNIHK